MIISIIRTIAFILFSIGLTAAIAEESRGKVIRFNDKKVEISYTGSYALLIGESDYTASGWQDLNSIPSELQQVEELLKSQGFQVQTVFNLNASQLRSRINHFFNQYGAQKNNRLLFFYAGHGHTHNNKGYLVPIDAPHPDVNEAVFLQKALVMDEIMTWARRFEAKHALFLFDSCFSGMLFKVREPDEIPRQIIEATALPVRQFITAGRANETVPEKSVFTPAFVNALRFAWGDMNGDGYVTGQELGLYLWNKVPQHSRQIPQYGKITDYDLSRGDFVFTVSSKKSLNVKVKYLYRHKGGTAFLPLSNDQTLYSGDQYQIVFTPFEKSYVYIFQQDSSGKIYQLFPNNLKGVMRVDVNPTQAGRTYYIPAPNQAFFLDQQTGIEKIYLIASRTPDMQLEKAHEQVLNLSDQLEQRLQICEGCVSLLEFQHK